MYLVAYVNNTKKQARVGWIEDESKPQRRGEGWVPLVFVEQWFSTKDAEAFLTVYGHFASQGYVMLNKRLPGSPLQKEIHWLKTRGTFECGLLDNDGSIAATVPGRSYPTVREYIVNGRN